MARKETITRTAILEAAFEMMKEEGIEQVTARRLANRAGCSTQPIFRVYANMEELTVNLFEKAVDFFETYYQKFPRQTVTPFVNLGLAYISFSSEYKNIFRFLFLSDNRYGKSMYDLVNGRAGAVGNEITAARNNGCTDPSGLFMKMWIFIHGAASMSLTGDYDLSKEETMKLLKDSYQAFRS